MINKGKVVTLRKLKSTKFLSQNRFVVLMSIVFVLGILISVIFYSADKSAFNWSGITSSLYFKRSSQKLFKMFLSLFLRYLTILIMFYVFGTSVMGVGVIPSLVFILGFLSGGISSWLYSVHSIKGIAFNALIILPISILFFTLCFFAAKSSFEFSLELSRVTLKKAPPHQLDFKRYSNTYIIYSVILVVITFVDVLISSAFLKLFKF